MCGYLSFIDSDNNFLQTYFEGMHYQMIITYSFI